MERYQGRYGTPDDENTELCKDLVTERLRHPITAGKFATQTSLQFDHSQYANVSALQACLPCPHMEILEISNPHGKKLQAETLIDTNTVVYYMEQPSMKRLVLSELFVYVDPNEMDSDYPSFDEIGYLNPVSGLVTLELVQVDIKTEAFAVLLRACRDLRCLAMTRTGHNSREIPLYDLAEALREVAGSLTAFSLHYVSLEKRSEGSLLPSLRYLKSLLSLTIDPCIYLGRLKCPHYPYPPPTLANPSIVACKEASSFADVLPDGVEKLTLHIDPDQVMRTPYYRRDIINSLIKARPNLPNLKEITLIDYEHILTCREFSLCTCGQCYKEMARVWRGGRRVAAANAETKRFVKQLMKIDIILYRDICDGTGRHECAARDTAEAPSASKKRKWATDDWPQNVDWVDVDEFAKSA